MTDSLALDQAWSKCGPRSWGGWPASGMAARCPPPPPPQPRLGHLSSVTSLQPHPPLRAGSPPRPGPSQSRASYLRSDACFPRPPPHESNGRHSSGKRRRGADANPARLLFRGPCFPHNTRWGRPFTKGPEAPGDRDRIARLGHLPRETRLLQLGLGFGILKGRSRVFVLRHLGVPINILLPAVLRQDPRSHL